MAPFFLLPVLGLLLDAVAGASNWTRPVNVCADLDPLLPAAAMLKGKHLLVHEVAFSPFAIKDPACKYGWRGFDIDVFSEISEMLGFTFDVIEAQQLPTETTWTETLVRTVDDVDLWLSWWMRDEERMNYVRVIRSS